ncbi:MAG: hypothetical protein QOG43_2176 [Actinomycetota bacterium]|jgi:hypothetical protein|nr:hypothetical protein [Actinomycetota bacterium]
MGDLILYIVTGAAAVASLVWYLMLPAAKKQSMAEGRAATRQFMADRRAETNVSGSPGHRPTGSTCPAQG